MYSCTHEQNGEYGEIDGILNVKHVSDVLGLEQFKLGHHNGGSQDLSRCM